MDTLQNQVGQIENAINTYSAPSQLKITDIRTAVVWSNFDYPIIRIDTNQGIYGIGEVRDAGHRENALQFKSMLVGKNPCSIDMIYRAMKQFGNWGREGGGVSGIEIALWDLLGKAYGVPCHQFLGGKYRDQVRIYADTPEPPTPQIDKYVERVLHRKSQGITFIKFDIGPAMLAGIPGALIGALGTAPSGHNRNAPGTGAGTWVTNKGIGIMRDVVAAVREAVGWETALCIDHCGHGFMTAKEMIRFGNAIEEYHLAWIEDPMPWYDIEGHKRVTDAILTPTAAGEELYLWDGFRQMIETRAVDIIHPDLLTSGGMLETKKIADYAERYGLPTAMHFAGSPIAFMANVHTAAAIPSFVALEHHALDLPFWRDLVTGLPEVKDGYVQVPDKPGLGIDLNLEVIQEHLRPWSGLFEPTEEWNTPKLGFYKPDRRWEK